MEIPERPTAVPVSACKVVEVVEAGAHAQRDARRARLQPMRDHPAWMCLSSRQRLAVEASIMGLTEAEICRMVGVGQGCLRAWSRRPEFRDAVEAGYDCLYDRSIRHAADLAEEAVERVARVLRGDDDDAALRAAQLLLAHGLRGRVLKELQGSERGGRLLELPRWRVAQSEVS